MPVLALLAMVMLGLFAVGAGGAEVALADEPWVEAGWSGDDLPNLSVVLRSISSSDPAIEDAVLPAMKNIEGVESAFADVLPGGPPVIHLVVPNAERLNSVTGQIRSISAELGIDSTAVGGELLVGGQLAADADVQNSIRTGLTVALIPVVLVVGIVVAALYGVGVGVASGLSTGLSAVLGALIGASVSGPFDGSLASTLVPGALVGLLVGATVSFRLISWFKNPTTADTADSILSAVRGQVLDLAFLLGPLGVAMVVGLLRGWNLPAAVFAAALFGALTTLVVMPAFLSTQGTIPDNTEFRAIPVRVPDGRDLPAAVLLMIAAVLLGLGFVAATTATSVDLIDAQTEHDQMSALVADQLVQLGGDPSSAIRATADGGDGLWFTEWATAASRYEGVEWVSTSRGRFEQGQLVSEGAAPIDDFTAIINPSESARSASTQATVRALGQIDTATGSVTLDGLPVEAEQSSSAADANLWILVGVLAALAGVVTFVLVRDAGLALIVTALRLLTTAAAIGVYHLVVGDSTASELGVLVLVLSTGISLFEVGLTRMIVESDEPESNIVSLAMKSGGGHALAGLAVVALAGIGLLATNVRLVAAFGIALAVAVTMEIALGIWALRPVILGEQALRSASPGPLGRKLMGRRGPIEGEPVSPEWRRVVAGLLREEFRFQTEPDQADLGTVFVEGTPLFGELQQHNLRLRQNGLRIRGEGPTVVSVKAVNDGDPVTVAITVDHPSRQLLAGDGRLIGVRTAERRDGMLWLAQDPSGRYRISEAVDMGSGVPIPEVAPSKAVAAKAK